MRPLAATYFAYFAFVGVFSPYFGLYLQSIGQSAFQIGVLLSLLQLVRIFAPNAWAWLADRRGARVPLLRGTLGFATLTFAGVLYVTDFWALFAVLTAFAIFSSATMPLVEALTLTRLGDRMARYGSVRLWGSVGFILAVVGSGWVLDRMPIARLPWLVLVGLAASLASAAFVRDRPTAPFRVHLPMLPMLARPDVAAVIGACFLMCVAHGPLYGFFSIYLDSVGYDAGTIGLLWAIGVIAEIVVFYTTPRWLGRVSAERVLVASFVLAVVRFLMIGWGVKSMPILVVAQVLHAASFGAYHVAAMALVNGWFSGQRQVRGQALYLSLSYGAGGFVGSVASGALWERIGPAWTFTAASVAAAMALLLVLSRGKLPAQSAGSAVSS